MLSLKPHSNKSKSTKSFKSKSPKVLKQKLKTAASAALKVENEAKKIISVQEPAKKKRVKYIMPSESITDAIINLSLQALDKLVLLQNKKNIIFGDETSIFLEIRCIKIQNTKGNIKFLLPHSTVATSGEVCLITSDLRKGKKIDHEPSVEYWEEILKKAEVTEVKTVLPMRQLRVEYDQYELKRRLLTQHDFIMVDTRVLNHVSHLLGKMFFKKHNMLIPVKLNEKKCVKKCINIGLRTAMLRLSEGETSTFLIGHTGMTSDKIRENILSFVKQLKEKYPGGEANIRSIFIKLPLSISLPLYITLRPSNTVAPPKLIKSKPKEFVEYEDELSTIPGKRVRVAPGGTVLVRNIEIMEESHTENDEDDEDNGEELENNEDNGEELENNEEKEESDEQDDKE